ncbi:MAG: hypothetical protein ACI8PZ_006268 [Myxococcota bacterium]|jgi:hypothetical protein
MSLYEDLSRLHAGELTDDQAAALRARIDAEPGVAAAWANLNQTLADLSALPEELAPPTLGMAPAAPSRAGWIVAALAMAAAVLLTLWPTSAPVVLLTDGVQWVDGDLTVHAGDAVVEVSGRASISVEPPPGFVRESGSKEDDMRTIVAALAGAVVTVAVYEGSAMVRAGASDGVRVEAGEQHTTAPERKVVVRKGGPPVQAVLGAEPGESPAQTIARLTEALEAATTRLAEADFERAVASGQLAVIQGEPSEWPDDVPDAYQPEAFEEGVRAAIADFPGTELVEVECSEYPCLGAIRLSDDIDTQALGESLKEWVTGALGTDSLSLSMNRSKFVGDEGEADFVLFGAHGGGRDDDVGRRIEHRMDGMVDMLEDQVGEGGDGGEADEDVDVQ